MKVEVDVTGRMLSEMYEELGEWDSKDFLDYIISNMGPEMLEFVVSKVREIRNV